MISLNKNINNDSQILPKCDKLLGFKGAFTNGNYFKFFLDKNESEEICNKVKEEIKLKGKISINVYEKNYPHKQTTIEICKQIEKIPDINDPSQQFEKVWDEDQKRWFIKRYYKYNKNIINKKNMDLDVKSEKDFPSLSDKNSVKSENIKTTRKDSESGYVESVIQNFGELFKKENKKSETCEKSNINTSKKIKSNKKDYGDKKEFINLIHKEINKLFDDHKKITTEYARLAELAKKAEKEKEESENILKEKKSEFDLYINKINKDSTKCKIIEEDNNKYLLITYENGTTIKLSLKNNQ